MNLFRSLNDCLKNLLFFLASALLTLPLAGTVTAQSQTPIFPVTTLISFPYDTSLSTPPVTADFNGDGKPDLPYISYTTPPTLNIALGFGGPSPTTVTTPLCPNAQSTTQFTVGDVNNDGKPDVVLTCGGYIMVLLGKGDGSFQAPAYYALNTYNQAPVLVDLNGDGYLDIAVLVTGTTNLPQLAVLLNKGVGGPGLYGTPQMYAAGTDTTYPEALAAGDFNGDGKQDLIAATKSGFMLFFGNGDGTLQAWQNQTFSTIPNGPGYFTVGDFNHDGITDVACETLYTSSPTVQILFGSTSGTLQQGPTLLPTPSNPPASDISIAAADLNGDGNLDLIVDDGLTYIFLGDGKGNFTQTASYAASGPPFVTDINGDGKPDLLLEGLNGISGIFILPGNGDGTFQAIPGTHVSGPIADVNGDGIADMVYLIPSISNQPVPTSIGTALGRGDGTFAALNPTASIPGISQGGYFLDPGDFNEDGRVDVVAIQTGVPGGICGPQPSPSQDAKLFSYISNGNGTFQPKGSGLDLSQIVVTGQGLVGDFNGDGKLDLVLPYYSSPTCGNPQGLLFIPGNGDGTFGTPVEFSSSSSSANNGNALVSGDLNNDGKLDFIWSYNNAVYLGNGDGTFKQIPLDVPNTQDYPIALGDLNGDGIPDLVIGPNVYAGNGDGTFQTTPFYTVTLPQYSTVRSATVGDVNGDGNPDLVEDYFTVGAEFATLSVSLGDGRGNFTQDFHTYFAGMGTQNLPGFPNTISLVRLNNSAPVSHDTTPDLLASQGVTVSSLLNQLNPAPNKPTPFASEIVLQVSPTSASTGASITLTATVTGLEPTGTVSFTANGTSLGTAQVSGGTATLQTSFADAGNYTVTAAYTGDPNNSPNTSNSVAITIAVPDFKISAQPSSATISPGQSATFIFTVTPSAGYNGTVNFSCGSLPAAATCSFSPANVTPTNGAAATTTLTIATTAPTTSMLKRDGPVVPWMPVGALALAGIFGFAIAPRKTRYWNRFLRGCSGLFLLAAFFLALNGCGSGSHAPSNPGTPPGSYSISVTAAGSANEPQHSMAVTLTVQ